MKRAVICPVCNGSGTYEKPNDPDRSERGYTCHGCDGKGWVTIGKGDWDIPYYCPTHVERTPYNPWDSYTTCEGGTYWGVING